MSENCQGGIKCAAVSFSSQENVRREEEGGPQMLVWMGICSDFNGAGSKIVKGFLCLPLLILYLLCSCVITLLTTHRLILFNFVCISFFFSISYFVCPFGCEFAVAPVPCHTQS